MPYDTPSRINRDPLHQFHPKYWLTWLGLGLLWVTTRLPVSWQRGLGKGLGKVMRRVGGRRRRIAETNLAVCFPDADAVWRDGLLDAHFASLGRGFLEMGTSWWKSAEWLAGRHAVQGLEQVEQLRAEGRGILFVAGHFTTLEIGARLLALHVPLRPVYRPHGNPVFNRIQTGARTRQSAGPIPRSDLRAMVRVLRRGGCVWYAPDQDFGKRQSVFAPFFGIPTSTLTATSRLARMSRAAVVPMTQARSPEAGGYRLILEPALTDFPGDNDRADAGRLNAIFEAWARERPADYLWVHRRFKTRPPGEAGFYDSV